jgi:hypothetical protein
VSTHRTGIRRAPRPRRLRRLREGRLGADGELRNVDVVGRDLRRHQRAGERSEVVEDLPHVRHALVEIALEHVRDDLGKALGHLRRGDAHVGDGFGLDREHVLREGQVTEGRGAGEHLVERHAERPHVAARVDGVRMADLLGRHVVGRSEHAALDRRAAGVRAEFRDAEIEHLHELVALGALDDEDVLGLEIAMDDVVVMRHLEGARALHRDRDGAGLGQLLLDVDERT